VARAQGPYNFALGFGGAQDKSNGLGIENASSFNAFASCTPSTADPTCQPNPALGHFFMAFGGDAMLSKRFGFGGGLDFQPTKGNYGPLQYRQEFYDFNGIYAPINNKHLTLRIEGGIGGAHTGFSILQSECIGIAVCSSYASSFGGSNHFQEHVSVGIQIPLVQHIFIRPQLEFRHVSGFTQQFGRDNVPEGMIWVGYNFGSYD
jgi:hypothetical protein